MDSYRRDLYFSEKHKQEIVRLCANNQKLSISVLENFCREAKEEILAWIRKPGFPVNDRENNYGDRNRSYGYQPEKKPIESKNEEFVPIFEPYIPRSPIGAQQNTHLSKDKIEKIRLSFIEQVYYATAFPIAYEDMASLINHSGMPLLVDDLLPLFGYLYFATMVREMPEFYFLDIFLDKDNKLWYMNKQMSNKTKFFQSEKEKPIPKKGVQISFAETVFQEPDMIHFRGRIVFVTVLAKCLKLGNDDGNGWVSFNTFQEYLSKDQKTDFKTAWKNLIPEIGKITRVWSEIVCRDIEYRPEPCELRLKDTPKKLLRRILKEEKEAIEFWNKLNVEMQEFVAEEEKAKAKEGGSSNDSWGDPDEWGYKEEKEIPAGEGNDTVAEAVTYKNVEMLEGENDKSVEQEIESVNEFEEVIAEDTEVNEDEAGDTKLRAGDESVQNDFPSSAEEDASATTPPIEEESTGRKSKFVRKLSRVIPDGTESDEEDYRVENCPARNDNSLFNLLSTVENKGTDAETLAEEFSDVEKNTGKDFAKESDDPHYIESEAQMKNNDEDREDASQSNISSTVDIVSETLHKIVEKVVTDEDGTEPKDDNEEIKDAEVNIETTSPVMEEDKESFEASKTADKKSSSFGKLPQTKSKFKKRPAFAARKVSANVPDGSDSDEEDVRMENSILPSDVTKVSKSDGSDMLATKPEIVDAKKKSFPPKAFTSFGKIDKKPNRRPKKYGLPADQMAKLSKSLDEMAKRYGLDGESSGRNNRDKSVKTKKHKAMMDFGSEAEYTDEDSSQPSTPPETKDEENEKNDDEPPASSVSFKPTFRPKQFQARIPKNSIKNKTPTKSDPNGSEK